MKTAISQTELKPAQICAESFPFPIISDDPVIQRHYERCRRQGTSHNLAEVFATRQTPALLTDAVFLQGHSSQFAESPKIGDYYKRVAVSEGQDTTGKVYLSTLANYPGDPRAWVSGRSDVKKLCEERGWDCDGAVKVRATRRDVEPAKPIGLADDIVETEVAQVLLNHPEPQSINREDLKDKIRQKRTPHWAKK